MLLSTICSILDAVFFFCGKVVTKRKRAATHTKDIFWKKWPSVAIFRVKKSEIACSGILPKYSGVPQKNLLSSLNYSQFWLSTLVDDHLTKLEEKKP